MEVGELFIYGVVAIVFQYALIYYAVYNSRQTERQHSRIQTALMVRMARKAGVAEEEIQESLKS